MRIKRFIAPDMRTALRMVRDDQGPDAVILSNRSTPDGIEVVAATDYDEALVTQALRAAAPALETPVAPVVKLVTPMKPVAPETPAPAPLQAPGVSRADEAAAAASRPHVDVPADDVVVQVSARATKAATTPATPAPVAAAATASNALPRESLMSRARAIFKLGHDLADAGPTLAELTAARPATNETAAPAEASVAQPDNELPRFEAMMAALNGPVASTTAVTNTTSAATREVEVEATVVDEAAAPFAIAAITAVAANDADAHIAKARHDADGCDADYLISLATSLGVASSNAVAGPAQVEAVEAIEASAAPAVIDFFNPGDAATVSPAIAVAPVRALHAVPAGADLDPAIVAMRNELATMRQLMEKQLEQLSLERLRGSPARAAALDALLAYGCDPALAQDIAAGIDPRLAPGEVLAPLRAALMDRFTLSPCEPIEDGGVIALVGPTGAGKTTTAAKLAARFAARHRARDVAMVSIDRERTGAREQLHAHGRRLGITVCDADNSDALGAALDQLQDYPLVLVDTAGYGVRDRALLRQILWLRSSSRVRSLLVLPANANPLDLGDIVRRYRPAAPEGVVLTKLDETGRPGAALSVLAQHGLSLAYTTAGQQVPADIEAADADRLALTLELPLEKSARAADTTSAIEDRHAFA